MKWSEPADSLAASATPFSILTKGTLIRRDLPLLQAAAEHVPVDLAMSIAVFDHELQQSIEPGTPSTEARLATVRAIREAGFDCTVLVMPILVGVADVTGVYAGMLAARWTLGLGTEGFLYGARLFWHDWDFFYSLTKAVAFGFVIPLVSVHAGLGAHGGAEGVGRATTASVVLMIVSVLCLDTLFPPLLLG